MESLVTLSLLSDIDVCPVWNGCPGHQDSDLTRLVFRLVLNIPSAQNSCANASASTAQQELAGDGGKDLNGNVNLHQPMMTMKLQSEISRTDKNGP